jgi:hypothetical protein
MGLIKAPHDSTRRVDIVFSNLINKLALPLLTEKDDDILVLCVGETGSGKSMLMLHAYDEFAGEEAIIDNISFNRENLADNLDRIKSLPKHLRFNGYDEANVSKRDATTKFNKALLDVYYTIRGLNIFHWWSNPSLEMIDKPFIKDRVTGVFLITTKSMDRPRTYYYFKKEKLLQIFKKYNNLDYETLNRVKKKYASYKGWFKDYTGVLKQPYLDKKNPRMDEKLLEFKAKFGTKVDRRGSKVYTLNQVSGLIKYAKQTIYNKVKTGFFADDEFIKNGAGSEVLLNEAGVLRLYKSKLNMGASDSFFDPTFKAWADRKLAEQGDSK